MLDRRGFLNSIIGAVAAKFVLPKEAAAAIKVERLPPVIDPIRPTAKFCGLDCEILDFTLRPGAIKPVKVDVTSFDSKHSFREHLVAMTPNSPEVEVAFRFTPQVYHSAAWKEAMRGGLMEMDSPVFGDRYYFHITGRVLQNWTFHLSPTKPITQVVTIEVEQATMNQVMLMRKQ